ncbi:MAG TPA: SiaB family protein kinase [Bacteroidales bacterium]|nr:SiaB family protein kinase [Bacteroidales bacterium]
MNTFIMDDLNHIDQVRKKMTANRIMLCYRGEMTQDIVVALLNLTENKLNQVSSDATIKNRVFSVMIECLQNITQHSEKSDHFRSNIFMMGYADSGYSIYSGNVVKSEKVPELKDKIHKINTMSEEELKDFYKSMIKSGSILGNTGSGLGLIQIARKTGNNLDYEFEKIDNEHYFFTLRTLVDH